jgi:hypothetical protein
MATQAPQATQSTQAAQAAQAAPSSTANLPDEKTLLHAARIALENDKPIMLDYFLPTKNGQAFLGEDVVTGEKSLVKSAEEYTSPIQKVFGTKSEYIVMTENSIYVVAGTIKKKKISMGGGGAPSVPALTN